MNGRPLTGIFAFVGLIAIYYGTYAANVVPAAPGFLSARAFSPAPSYRLGGRAAEAVFYPAHLADRVLRPDLWNPRFPFT